MATDEGQTALDIPLSDETLRLYLLCRLREAERLKLDERLLVDDELATALLLAESELIDDHVSGRLDRVETEFFDKSFLTTESRREKLRFASALHDYAGVQTSEAPHQQLSGIEGRSWREGMASLFGFPRTRVWAVAGSFALVIMLVGLALFAARQSGDTAPVITRNEPTPAWSPEASPQPATSLPTPVSSESPPAPSIKPVMSPEPPAPAIVASFVLLPGAIRGGGDLPRVAVPDGERDIVRLKLVLETGADGVYRAELTTAEGQKVTVRSKLKPDSQTGNPKLTIDIPARLLQSGDYQVKLGREKADGQAETVGRYYFRALD